MIYVDDYIYRTHYLGPHPHSVISTSPSSSGTSRQPTLSWSSKPFPTQVIGRYYMISYTWEFDAVLLRSLALPFSDQPPIEKDSHASDLIIMTGLTFPLQGKTQGYLITIIVACISTARKFYPRPLESTSLCPQPSRLAIKQSINQRTQGPPSQA
jgi:hypothetical protein